MMLLKYNKVQHNLCLFITPTDGIADKTFAFTKQKILSITYISTLSLQLHLLLKTGFPIPFRRITLAQFSTFHNRIDGSVNAIISISIHVCIFYRLAHFYIFPKAVRKYGEEASYINKGYINRGNCKGSHCSYCACGIKDTWDQRSIKVRL